MGAFGQVAFEFCDVGLAPIPTGGRDGKSPVMRGYANPKAIVNLGNVGRLIGRHSEKNVALVCGPSNIAVVDIDDSTLHWSMVKRFGATPLVVQTASGGVHLYYRDVPQARSVNLRSSEGLAVEVKAKKNIVIAPPSKNFKTGKGYRFLDGDFSPSTLKSLPPFKADAIHAGIPAARLRAVMEGERNEWLFQNCLKEAPHVDGFEDLLDVARTRNDECEPILDDAEVVKVASSAWRYQITGRNFYSSHGFAPAMPLTEVMALAELHPGDTAALLCFLRIKHSARMKRGETFHLATDAMEKANVLPGWSRKHYRMAIDRLLDGRFLEVVRQGRPGVAAEYVLSDPLPKRQNHAAPFGGGVLLHYGPIGPKSPERGGGPVDAAASVSGFIHPAGRA